MFREVAPLPLRVAALDFVLRARPHRELGKDDQLMNIALRARADDKLDAARYFEARPGGQDRAVRLYHKVCCLLSAEIEKRGARSF